MPDVIGSSEAVPSGAASALFPLAFFFLLHSAAPGVQSAAPGAAGSAEAGAPWAPSCFFRVEIFADWASLACRSVSKSVSEMKMDSDSGDGVIDGFLTLNVPDADFLCQLDTMHQGFIFGDFVGCCKMNLEHIMQLISSWRSEHHASP